MDKSTRYRQRQRKELLELRTLVVKLRIEIEELNHRVRILSAENDDLRWRLNTRRT
jgi:uncharacterized protein YlxW (UPF0749 family)